MPLEPGEVPPPIPPLSEPPNWGRLPIHECGEPLVTLEDGHGSLRVRSLYAEQGIPGAPDTVSVRSGVRDRLLVAAATLRDYGATLVIFDGYRPLVVQQYLYDSYYQQVARERPELTVEAITAIVRQFVAAPTPDPLRPPPHRTGGAVDVYLVDAATGAELPMGTEADEVSPLSVTYAFESAPQEPFTRNRRLLFHAMTGAGFANYPGEWWHFDFGNQRWANITGAPHAHYGIAIE